MESPNSSAPLQSLKQSAEPILDQRWVVSALQTLSAEHRQVLFECYVQRASVAGAARTLGVPADTIKSRIHEALHALRRATVESDAVP